MDSESKSPTEPEPEAPSQAKKPRRYYNNIWPEHFPWLEYRGGRMFCSVCCEAKLNSKFAKNAFVAGSENFQKSALDRHQVSSDHQLSTSILNDRQNKARSQNVVFIVQTGQEDDAGVTSVPATDPTPLEDIVIKLEPSWTVKDESQDNPSEPVCNPKEDTEHFAQHSVVTMYPCYHCPQKFRTKREMKAHYEENHQVKPQGDPPEDPSVLKRRLSSPDMEIERPPVPCTQLNPCPDHPQHAPVSCTQLNPCPDHPPVSSTQLDPCPNPPPVPYSLADARCQALAVLEEGRMPLVAAAPRLWSRDRQVILPGGIHWPPRGTAAMDSDLKLLHLEGAAMQLATWAGLPITGRRELLDTFRILSLPGTAYPPASTAVQRARDLMYEVVLQVAGGDLGDPTCLGLVQALLHTPSPAGLLQDIGQSLQGIGVDISH